MLRWRVSKLTDDERLERAEDVTRNVVIPLLAIAFMVVVKTW